MTKEYDITTLCKGCGHYYPTVDRYDQFKFEEHRDSCENKIGELNE